MMKLYESGGKAFLILLISAAAIFSGASCGSSGSGRGGGNRANGNRAGGDDSKSPSFAITVGKSTARQVASTIQATGSLVADETSDIAPKVAGKISNVSANVGQFVSQGSVVAKIDDTTARQQLAQANASVKQAIAGVRQAEARLGLSPNGKFDSSSIPEVRAANANYQQALAELKQAETNEQRYRELVESGDVSMMQYETYRTTRDTARARANSAKETLEAAINTAKQSNQAIATAQAAVETARTQVAEAQQAIADTVVRAPFSGYISSRPAAVGEFVSSASIVATIIRSNPMKIQIQVPEADVPAVSVGRGVSLEVDAYKQRRFAGSVSAVNPAIDPVSRSATVEARIENGDNSLRSGMFATVRINKEGGVTAIYVPKAAVYHDPSTNSYRIFVIQDGIAKLSVVQLGIEEGDAIQILSGVDADQTIATSNVDQLYEGAKVTF